MNLLTDEEIISIAYDDDTSAGPITFARAIEAAVLEKVGKVDVEPVAYHYCYTNAFGHPVWGVGFHVPSDATEWHDLIPVPALAALRAENEELRRHYAEHVTGYNLTINTLRAQLEQAQADLALREAEVSSLQIDKELAQADAARWRFVSTKGDEDEQYIGERWEACMEAWDGSDGVVGFERAIDAARAALGEGPAHTDHIAGHWDRNCPACNASVDQS